MKNSLLKILKQYPSIETFARRCSAKLPGSRRTGADFWKWYALFDEMEGWPIEQLREYQIEQLRRLLGTVSVTSPYYRSLLKDINLDSVRSQADLAAILAPISRLEYTTNIKTITSQGLSGRFYTATTSGTTGTALQFKHDRRDDQREWAAICHQWKRVGFDPVKSVRAEFRGMTSHRQLVQKFPDQGMIRLSILDISGPNLGYFADAIRNSGADFYHGYPSAIYLLAKEIKLTGFRFPQPTGILLASEQVYDWQLKEIRSVFPEALVIAHYGCAERVVLSAWCEHEQIYHVLPHYSLVEIDETTREIIGTNLYNTINPFIRYRMTDSVTSFEQKICKACHRPCLPLMQLSGRSEDFLFSPQRGWIPPAIVTYPLKNLRVIKELRFLQAPTADITVQFTTHDGTLRESDTETATIKKGLLELTGDGVGVCFEHVAEIERTATGKFKWIVSEYQNGSPTQSAA